jgi:hypothetical protein
VAIQSWVRTLVWSGGFDEEEVALRIIDHWGKPDEKVGC